MYPLQGFRVVQTDTDFIFEKKHNYNYTRISLPGLASSTVQFLTQYCDFYKCNLSKETFNHQVQVYKEEALKLFKDNINDCIVNKSYLHQKISLCNVGLDEDWHSPVFFIKLKSKVMATTGHNKIYATYLRRKKLNLDFDCYVLDFDKDPEDFFLNIKPILSDSDFSNAIGFNGFAIDISLEKTPHGYIPCIMQFSKNYPIVYHNGSFELTTNNALFFKNNKTSVKINDKHNSIIYDSSGIFDINDTATMVFTTNAKIKFDLSDLLPFLTHSVGGYKDEMNLYSFTVSNVDVWKKTCPANLL